MVQHMSIRKKIIVSSVSILLLSLLLSGSFFFVSYFNIRKEDTLADLDTSLTHITDTLSSNFSSINNLASTFCSTYYMRQWIDNAFTFDTDSPETYDIMSSIKKELRYQLIFNDAWLNKYINTIYLFADNRCISLTSRIAAKPATLDTMHDIVFQKTKELDRGTYLLPPTTPDTSGYYIKKLSNNSFTKDLVLIMSLNPLFFGSSIQPLSQDTMISIYNADHEVFFASSEDMEAFQTSTIEEPISLSNNGYVTINGKPYLNIVRKIHDTNLFISMSLPSNHITGKLVQSLLSYLIIMILFIVIVTCIAIIVVGNYTRIIEDILYHIEQIRFKNYGTRMPTYRDQNLNQISSTFNTMASEFEFLIDSVYKNEILLKEADIKLLQSQMNPHFLLNTLTTISTKALMCGDTELYEMVHALSSLLSASLCTKQDSLCKISDELEYVEMYLYIQHIRFGDKIKYHINVETDDLLAFYIPRLSIEPLVENATIHGLNTQLQGGIINIHIQSLDTDTLLVTIKDNGKGFDVEKVLNSPPPPNTKGHHIGIFNTDKRLKLLYGEEYGITFESSLGKGTTAFIKIPKHYHTYYHRED